MVQKLVTYLEMTAPDQLRPAAPAEGLEIARVTDPGRHAGRIRDLHDAIATPHHWSSLDRSPDGWKRLLGEPRFVHWIASVDGRDVGWAHLVSHDDGSVEIGSFGLRPDAVGRGYGGAFLTELVGEAWELPGGAARVWLHTSSWDHPHALANYRARGFAVSRLELQERHADSDERETRPVEEPPRFLVRPAVPQDAERVAALVGDLGYELPVAVAEERVGGLAASPRDLVAVAVEHLDEVVGLVSAHAVPMLAEPAGAFARIIALSVAPRVARSGVGRQLVGLVEYWARGRGIRLVEVSSGRRRERTAAHDFYRALGFEDTATHAVRYWKRLDGET